MADKEERIERIYTYFEEINDSPIVYHWKYHMSEIDPEEAIGLANYKSLSQNKEISRFRTEPSVMRFLQIPNTGFFRP